VRGRARKRTSGARPTQQRQRREPKATRFVCAVANSAAQLADAGKCSIAVERERVLEDETLTRGSEAQLSRLLCGDDEGPVRVSLGLNCSLSLFAGAIQIRCSDGVQSFFFFFVLFRFFWLCVDAVYQKDDLSC